ncbi:hypothetical protein LAWI1_G004080, partial [Lachnellula willkommii]
MASQPMRHGSASNEAVSIMTLSIFRRNYAITDQIIGFAIKGIVSGVGLVSESIKANEAKKPSKKGPGRGADVDAGDSRIQNEEILQEQGDEEEWDLKELVPQTSDKAKQTRDLIVIVQQFVLKYSLLQVNDPVAVAKLAFPVILPQRRPKKRARGFIRAYAPSSYRLAKKLSRSKISSRRRRNLLAIIWIGEAEHPESFLAQGPEDKFSSRYADPHLFYI